MTTASHGPAPLANRGADTRVGEPRHESRLISAVMRAAHGLWQRKPSRELAARTGTDPRTCERWLSLRTGMSADALAALLRSEEGLAFLDALMAGAAPGWWQDFRAAIEREQINRQLSELRRQLKARDQRAGVSSRV